jgi:ATP-dependent RNA helicase DDX10/DBP4
MTSHSKAKDSRRHTNPERPKTLKRKREAEDVDALNTRVDELDAQAETPSQSFTDLPLSEATQNGLSASHFKTLTTIQGRAIPSALKGGDILGAAKTGSGKTLAFLVPVLENLYRKRWTEYDGIGALILSPTRELAIQIFEVLRKVGRYHTFSAGLVIGGKSLQEERDRLGRMNILVATPGRMQQHLDQTADLEVGNLQMLVLDEADRIMDMGFSSTVDAIVEHLPKQRQTLMFSATQTKRVSDLARLSLTEPEFVSVHSGADTATPANLQQNYVVTPLPEKLDTLWSFLRANVKKKTLVFLSSGKQVRFVYESFRHLQPGVSLLHLHGRQRQSARLDITNKFSNSKFACLFATDVAARGLDFPAVDWVVQVDCPEDADTYIHRVGRTARYEHDGRAVIFVDPSEEDGMLKSLEKKKVFLERINVRQAKMQNTVKNQLQNMCFKDPELKYLGQKAFVSYVKSIALQKDKVIFDVTKLDLEGFAASMGLPGAPRVKFIKGEDAKSRKNMPRQLRQMLSDSEGDQEAARSKQSNVRTKYDRMFERQNQDVLAGHYTKLIEEEEEIPDDKVSKNQHTNADRDEGFLSVKRRYEAGDEALGCDVPDESSGDDTRDKRSNLNSKANGNAKKAIKLSENADPLVLDSNRRMKLVASKAKLAKKAGGHGEHLHFSSDSEKEEPYEKHYYQKEAEFEKAGAPEEQRRRFVEEETRKVKERDVFDRQVAKEKKREKKDRKKERERLELEAGMELDGDDEVGVQLVPYEEDVMPEQEHIREKKRSKKWFEDASDENDQGKKKRKRQAQVPMAEPETLEDLEAMASSLLTK